ncbi:MAG: succinate dehydrogenase [Draconibacterium sp.]|nr:MAG: succinate dehydrogenase [Draconibacterium sp.]
MSKFLSASIGRKFLMSITGFFLLVFVAVHLIINLLLIFDSSGEAFNIAAHFMATNPAVKIAEPILGLGFLIHILWSLRTEYINWKARPKKYTRKDAAIASTWASRNMLVLGALIVVFLVIHIINFYWIIKFGKPAETVVNGEHMHDTYALVSGLFINNVFYCIVYVIGAILLGLHLSHGFWSAFQTLGLNNKYWMKRLQFLAKAYAFFIAVGFSIIPLYFLIFK